MVNSDNTILAPSPLRRCDISTEEVRNNAYRLNASAYDIETMEALSRVYHSPYDRVCLWGENGSVEEAYHGPRAKRNYLPAGIPFIGGSEMLEVKPNPTKFVDKSFLDNYGVRRGQVLLSCSGIIGCTSSVDRTLEGYCASQHALKVTANYAGYVYAYLSTEVGKSIVKSFTYGAVIDEIEPEHLKDLPIPNASEEIKRSTHNVVIASYDSRDQSNGLIDEAQQLLYETLSLSGKMDLKPKYCVLQAGFRCFTMYSNELNNRFDIPYHLPEIKEIPSLISKQAAEVTTLSDPGISKEIILSGRFRRIYIEEEQGVPFFGGKQLLQLDPSEDKHLSLGKHIDRIKRELSLEECMCLISRSGTIGKVIIVPKRWSGWVVNEHCLRLSSRNKDTTGYVYAWLSTDYVLPSIVRHIYGAVVDEIDDKQLSEVAIPLLKDSSMQSRTNNLVLQVDELRYQAYLKEQEALQQMEKVLKR